MLQYQSVNGATLSLSLGHRARGAVPPPTRVGVARLVRLVALVRARHRQMELRRDLVGLAGDVLLVVDLDLAEALLHPVLERVAAALEILERAAELVLGGGGRGGG